MTGSARVGSLEAGVLARCRCQRPGAPVDEPARDCPAHGQPEVMLDELRTNVADPVVVSRADLVAYLNRGTGDVAREVAALNRLLAAAGIED